MKLSKNFSLSEFTRTSHEVYQKDNAYFVEHPAIIRNLRSLCNEILQPIRDELDKPVLINSGFRTKALNSRLSGFHNSQHMYGEAADIRIKSVGLDNAFDIIRQMPLVWGQLILEPGWIHISLPQCEKPYMEILQHTKKHSYEWIDKGVKL